MELLVNFSFVWVIECFIRFSFSEIKDIVLALGNKGDSGENRYFGTGSFLTLKVFGTVKI